MDYIDLYCERLGPGLLAEPVNVVSNAAFFIAAWALWRFALATRTLDWEVKLLVGIIVAIGVGSTTFHTFATMWAQFLDVLPILLFQLAYLWIYSRRVIGWPPAATTVLVGGFLAAALFSRQYPHLLSGSLMYAPAIAVLLALAFYHRLSRKMGSGFLFAASGVFALSLVLRTVDEAMCPLFPLGTHFVWHLLNPLVLYLCVRCLIETRRRG